MAETVSFEPSRASSGADAYRKSFYPWFRTSLKKEGDDRQNLKDWICWNDSGYGKQAIFRWPSQSVMDMLIRMPAAAVS